MMSSLPNAMIAAGMKNTRRHPLILYQDILDEYMVLFLRRAIPDTKGLDTLRSELAIMRVEGVV